LGWAAVFQQLDLDYTLGEPHAMADWKEGPVPIIHMYGLTREGHSVLVHLHGVLPYFYVPAPHAQFSEDDCESFRLALNVPLLAGTLGLGVLLLNANAFCQQRRCASHARGAKERKDYVIAVAVEQKESIMGYHADKRKPFLRITMAMPPLVPAARGQTSSSSLPTFGLARC
jgi:DNA polymerase delta subunit 1